LDCYILWIAKCIFCYFLLLMTNMHYGTTYVTWVGCRTWEILFLVFLHFGGNQSCQRAISATTDFAKKKTFFSVFNLIKTSRSIYVKSEFSQKMKSFWEKSTIFFAISKFDIYFVYDLYVNNSCKDMILLCFNFHFSTSKFPMKLNNETRPFLILIIKRKYRLKKTLDFFARSSSRSYLKQKKLLLLNGFQINAISHNNCWEMYW